MYGSYDIVHFTFDNELRLQRHWDNWRLTEDQNMIINRSNHRDFPSPSHAIMMYWMYTSWETCHVTLCTMFNQSIRRDLDSDNPGNFWPIIIYCPRWRHRNQTQSPVRVERKLLQHTLLQCKFITTYLTECKCIATYLIGYLNS